MGAYQKLMEAPDPAPLITASVQELSKLTELTSIREENQRLKSELNETTKENAKLKAIAESGDSLADLRWKDKVSQLENKIAELQSTASAKSAIDEQEVKDKLKFMEERENDLLMQLATANQELRKVQSQYEARIQAASANQEFAAGHSSSAAVELSLAEKELEKLRSQCTHYEYENAVLKRDLDSLKRARRGSMDVNDVHGDPATVNKFIQLKRLLDERTEDIERLRKEIAERDKQLVLVQSNTLSGTEKWKELYDQQLQKFKELSKRAEMTKDYEELKKELKMLKSIEFAGIDEDNQKISSVETLALQQNRRLQKQVTDLRVQNNEFMEHMREMRIKIKEQTVVVQDQKSLITKLEQDLLAFNAKTAALTLLQSSAGQSPNIRTESSDTSAGLHSAAPSLVPSSAAPSADVFHPSQASLLPIITSQRDRFHDRNIELESENRQLKTKISDIQNDAKSIREDNVRLYEKIRYLQSYRQNSITSTRDTVLDIEDGRRRSNAGASKDDILQRYADIYDQKMNPFQQFHQRQQNQRFNSLSPTDKVALSISRMLVTNRYTRLVVVFYLGFLHLLVFGTLIKFQQVEECQHNHDAQFWKSKFLENHLPESVEGKASLKRELTTMRTLLDKRLDALNPKYPISDGVSEKL